MFWQPAGSAARKMPNRQSVTGPACRQDAWFAIWRLVGHSEVAQFPITPAVPGNLPGASCTALAALVSRSGIHTGALAGPARAAVRVTVVRSLITDRPCGALLLRVKLEELAHLASSHTQSPHRRAAPLTDEPELDSCRFPPRQPWQVIIPPGRGSP